MDGENEEAMNDQISYPQSVDIIIEFSINVLQKNRSLQELDITWDDVIQHVITRALQEHGFSIKNTRLVYNSTMLSYHMTLIAYPPEYDLSCIVKALDAEGYGRGLTLKKATKYSVYELLYGGNT